MQKNVLWHHGIKGMKWGVRRYQNEDGTLTAAGKKRYFSEMRRDQETHFKNQLSKEARKVTTIGRNGNDIRGNAWNSAYRKGKVTSKDDAEIRRAAKNTREYMATKYGKETIESFRKSGVLSTKVSDLKISSSDIAKIKKSIMPLEQEDLFEKMAQKGNVKTVNKRFNQITDDDWDNADEIYLDD